MVLNQPTMRTNQYIDILMGANNFTDFIRIANGLSTISQYDKKTLSELVQIIATLNKQKEELVVAKNELEIQKQEKRTTFALAIKNMLMIHVMQILLLVISVIFFR